MLKLVSRAFKKRKKPAKKARRDANKATVLPAPAQQDAPIKASPADDELSLEELEGMVVATPQPKTPPTAPAPATKAASAPRHAAAEQPAPAAPAQQPAPAPPAAPTSASAPLSPEREALLRNAMSIQRKQKAVFDDLDDEDREKLYVMAMKAMVDKDFGEN